MKKSPIRFQKVSDFGASNPAVARLIVAPCEWVKCFDLPQKTRDAVAGLCFEHVGRQAAECYKIAKDVAEEMVREEEKFTQRLAKAKAENREPQELPSIVNCRTRCEYFLDHAQSSLLEASKLVDLLVIPLPCPRNYRAIQQYLTSKMPQSEALEFLRSSEEALKRLALLRNAARHHDGKDGRLTVHNYIRHPSDPFAFFRPTWQLNDESREWLEDALSAIAEFVTAFGEGLLMRCLADSKATTTLPLKWSFIPRDKRNPSMPFAYEVQALLGDRWLPFSAS